MARETLVSRRDGVLRMDIIEVGWIGGVGVRRGRGRSEVGRCGGTAWYGKESYGTRCVGTAWYGKGSYGTRCGALVTIDRDCYVIAMWLLRDYYVIGGSLLIV